MVGLVELGIVYNLGMRFPQKTLTQYSEILLGKILGKMLSFGYIAFLIFMSFFVVSAFTDFITIHLMPETPRIVFNFFLTLLAAYAVFQGLEVIARIAQFVLPLGLLGLSFLILFPLFNADFSQLLPFFDKGIPAVLSGVILPAALFGELAVLTFLLPMTNKPQEVFKNGAYGLLTAGFFLTAVTTVTIAVFGPEQTQILLFPFLHLAKSIKVMGIQRLEYFVIFIWVSGIVVKIAVLYYIECFTIVKVLALKDKKLVMMILGILQVIVPNYMFKNSFESGMFFATYWAPFALLFELAIPLLLLLLAVIKGKKVRRLN